MKKPVSILLASLLALPVFAGPGRHHTPFPPRHHPIMRPMPPPPPYRPHHRHPRFEPAVAGIIGFGLGTMLFAPQYQWVPGHWETVSTVLPGGQIATSTVWVPGQYVRIR